MKLKAFFLLLFFTIISCEHNNDDDLNYKTLIIASTKVDCVGVDPQKCLLIREVDKQNWEYFYDSIIGFNYEEGFEFEILISEEEIENSLQDASSIKTTLIKVISKIEKTSENLPN
ncbi:DUF4377 domain-containing protein [Polaribacter sp. Z014]|uniref:DUF4377 domain-containing protein n=1 Tax=unclassified Polaribacter TaxID=196858 RepID=UPI00193C3FB0|nr:MULTISPECIES: DUF4377 domain-containing protein [unclassified Polaribacter]MCL7762158.1 DUF4377 domain-containing protein [Polaribacter sp. Z014]QVY64414.1 DUF4377 domain-containing protein [Polaribacter sp. Q13]